MQPLARKNTSLSFNTGNASQSFSIKVENKSKLQQDIEYLIN